MMINLDPTILPELDILQLAQSGAIVRAERETPNDGVPTFVTKEGWEELVNNHNQTNETSEETSFRVLRALERISKRLINEAAKKVQNNNHLKNSSLFSLETDLFLSSQETCVIIVKDKTHSVACALIGTSQHFKKIIRSPDTKKVNFS